MTSLHFNVGIKPWFDDQWDSFQVFPRLAAQAAGWNTTGIKNLFEVINQWRPAETHVNIQSPAEADSDVVAAI